jgi:hypothetical protein
LPLKGQFQTVWGGGSLLANRNSGEKKLLIVITILLALCIGIGISYAYWLSRVTQTTINAVSNDCLKITLTDANPIKLEKAYPISDSEAKELTPYTFTIKNTCNTSITYDVTLEIMQNDKRLVSEYIALQVDDEDKKILSNYTSVEPTYSDDEYTAVEARNIKEGTLNGNESVTYNIRLWMDESVTSEDSMNKFFTSKISVVATQEQELITLLDYISTLALTDTENLVADDETEDHNIRYIGANPNNYLCFDKDCTNGYWRVIGVMNNIETKEHGNQSLVKIIRAESIGGNKWDDNNVNDWTTSTLQENLNSGELYTTYIKNYDSLFETVTWNLGGVSLNELLTAVPSTYYELERGDSVYSGHETTWSGKIGLVYTSDYGYATSGGRTTDRKTCLATDLYNWDEDCIFLNYLAIDYDYYDYYDYYYLWTLTPLTDYSESVLGLGEYLPISISSDGYMVEYFDDDEQLQYTTIDGDLVVRPVGYLISNTKILSGNGSNETPWIISN